MQHLRKAMITLGIKSLLGVYLPCF